MNWNVSSGGLGDEWWKSETGGWATWVVTALLLGLYGVRILIRTIKKLRGTWDGQSRVLPSSGSGTQPLASSRPTLNLEKVRSLVTGTDLQRLLEELEESSKDETPWEPVIDKRNERVAYCAKRRDPQDGGPTQYLSTTIFENCSTELLRNFYMDDVYRMTWDSTIVKHEQLEICRETGVEVGRTVKKFPFLSPREYVLAWRVWEGKDKTFYCFVKACKHVLAPRHPKYKRVECYRSGWRIHKVPGKNACEIKMWHQEDIGLQREMAKVAFSRSIWSYVCKMDVNMRKYVSTGRQLEKDVNAVAFAQQVPTEVNAFFRQNTGKDIVEQDITSKGATRSVRKVKFSVRQSGKWFAKGLLLFGGAVFCTRGAAPLGAKLAALCVMRRMIQPQAAVNENEARRQRHVHM